MFTCPCCGKRKVNENLDAMQFLQCSRKIGEKEIALAFICRNCKTLFQGYLNFEKCDVEIEEIINPEYETKFTPEELEEIKKHIPPCNCKIYPFSGKKTCYCKTCGKKICNNCSSGNQCADCRFDMK